MKDRRLKFEVLLQGIGMLISWNAVMTAIDWFSTRFPGYNIGVIFGMCNFGPGLIFQSLTIWKGNNFSYNLRVNGGYVIIGTILILLPIVTVLLEGLAGLIVVSMLIVVMGSANAISQTTSFGIAGCLPNTYTNLVMIGNGVAGLIITFFRLICLAGFTGVSNGLLLSSLIYFIISGVFLIVCIFAQLNLMKNPIVIRALGQTSDKVSVGPGEPLKNPEEVDSPVELAVIFSWKSLFGHIWQYMFLVWLCYLITFGVLTHVSIATESTLMPYPYFETLMFLTYNLFDFAGRMTPTLYTVTGKLLWVLMFSRFVFWLTCILIASDDPSMDPAWLFSFTWFKFVNMMVFAYSNGYLSTCCMIEGPSHTPPSMKDRAGYIMATFLILGIFSGNVVALAFSGVGHIPSD